VCLNMLHWSNITHDANEHQASSYTKVSNEIVILVVISISKYLNK